MRRSLRETTTRWSWRRTPSTTARRSPSTAFPSRTVRATRAEPWISPRSSRERVRRAKREPLLHPQRKSRVSPPERPRKGTWTWSACSAAKRPPRVPLSRNRRKRSHLLPRPTRRRPEKADWTWRRCSVLLRLLRRSRPRNPARSLSRRKPRPPRLRSRRCLPLRKPARRRPRRRRKTSRSFPTPAHRKMSLPWTPFQRMWIPSSRSSESHRTRSLRRTRRK